MANHSLEVLDVTLLPKWRLVLESYYVDDYKWLLFCMMWPHPHSRHINEPARLDTIYREQLIVANIRSFQLLRGILVAMRKGYYSSFIAK